MYRAQPATVPSAPSAAVSGASMAPTGGPMKMATLRRKMPRQRKKHSSATARSGGNRQQDSSLSTATQVHLAVGSSGNGSVAAAFPAITHSQPMVALHTHLKHAMMSPKQAARLRGDRQSAMKDRDTVTELTADRKIWRGRWGPKTRHEEAVGGLNYANAGGNSSSSRHACIAEGVRQEAKGQQCLFSKLIIATLTCTT